MRKLILSGLVLGMGGVVAPAAPAQSGMAPGMTSGVAMARGMNQMPIAMNGMRGTPPRGNWNQQGNWNQGNPGGRNGAWGQRVNGRWSAGWNAPGGWNGYRRPVSGFTLPSYWINPSFYISDYRGFGLPAPAYGYGWSRYYDDAVMTDRYGRVVDVRYGYDWDRYGGYEDSYGDGRGAPYPYDDGRYAPGYRDNRTGNTIAGAVVGGVIGGVAGSAIAGRGNRTGGAILGAGIGAIAGGVLGNSASKPKKVKAPRYATPAPYGYGYGSPPPQGFEYGDGYADNGVSAGGPVAYDGRWVGTWYGRDGSSYSGAYEGQFDGYAQGAYAQGGYPAPLPAAPAYGYGYGYGYDASSAYGYSAYGANSYYEESAETVAPTIVTTTVTEETYATTAKKVYRKPVRKARPRVRVTCSCSCRC